MAGYDEDVVFLGVPDESVFGKRIPLVIGTCTLARVINVIKESEMDQISTPWATVHLVQLLSRCVMAEESHKDKNVTGQAASPADEMDEVIEMKDSVPCRPISSRDFEGKSCMSTCA